MWKHWRVLDSETTHTNDDTTYKVKLPKSNILHSMLVKVAMTNGATNCEGMGMTDVVDWIKVIADGSRVLFHLEPETIRMMSLFDGLGNLREVMNEQASVVQEAFYPILFGRDWFDPNFYLPLSRFSDLELQIKYSPTIAATAFATGTFKTTVLGGVSVDGAPGTYQGSLVTRIIENFTSAASGDKVIEPPQRWPYFALLVRAYEAAIADGVDISDVQFDINDEQTVPLKMKWTELKGLNQVLRPTYTRQNRWIERQNNDTVATQLSAIRQALIACEESLGIAGDTFVVPQIDSIAGDTLTLDIGQGDITAGAEDLTALATDGTYRLSVFAQGLPFAVYIPLSPMGNEGFFDPTVFDQVKLTLTQAAAGADVDVVLVEVQSFPA